MPLSDEVSDGLASMTFSVAVRSITMRVCWKVRPMPWRATWKGRSPVMSVLS